MTETLKFKPISRSFSNTNMKQRVANGARWLDENFPGWEDRIDLDTLSLYDGSQCICGQLFAEEGREENPFLTGYSWAYRHLFGEANSWVSALVSGNPQRPSFMGSDRAHRVARAFGFNEDHRRNITFDGLQKEWKKLLRARAASKVLNG